MIELASMVAICVSLFRSVEWNPEELRRYHDDQLSCSPRCFDKYVLVFHVKRHKFDELRRVTTNEDLGHGFSSGHTDWKILITVSLQVK